MTIFSRHMTLSIRKVFFGIGVFSYLVIAVMGLLFSIVSNHGLPSLPGSGAWPYLLIEGLFIPTAWLIQYKIIGHIGAGNTAIVSIVNTVGTSILGILLLHEGFSFFFAVGAALIMTSALISLTINPDSGHHRDVPLRTIVMLIFIGMVFFAVGMYSEKVAINIIGVWNYSAFGWGMQSIGAATVFTIFGRKEIKHINRNIAKKGLLLGLITSVSGGLYIYALSLGGLSHTIIATSGKIAITVLLAALLLHERNNFRTRIVAFLLALAGLWLVVS